MFNPFQLWKFSQSKKKRMTHRAQSLYYNRWKALNEYKKYYGAKITVNMEQKLIPLLMRSNLFINKEDININSISINNLPAIPNQFINLGDLISVQTPIKNRNRSLTGLSTEKALRALKNVPYLEINARIASFILIQKPSYLSIPLLPRKKRLKYAKINK